MPIRTIEVICIPCDKCDRAMKQIRDAIKAIETQHKTKVIYEFKHTPSLQNVSQYSVNASQAPIIVINGNVELSGRFDQMILNNKLEQFFRS